jgi:hypothetical protein
MWVSACPKVRPKSGQDQAVSVHVTVRGEHLLAPRHERQTRIPDATIGGRSCQPLPRFAESSPRAFPGPPPGFGTRSRGGSRWRLGGGGVLCESVSTERAVSNLLRRLRCSWPVLFRSTMMAPRAGCPSARSYRPFSTILPSQSGTWIGASMRPRAKAPSPNALSRPRSRECPP